MKTNERKPMTISEQRRRSLGDKKAGQLLLLLLFERYRKRKAGEQIQCSFYFLVPPSTSIYSHLKETG